MSADTLTLLAVSLEEVRAVLGRPVEDHEDVAAIIDVRAAWEPGTLPYDQQVVTADEALRSLLAGGPWVPGGERMYWYAFERLCRARAWAVDTTPWDPEDPRLAEALVRCGVGDEHLPSAWLAQTPRLGLEPVGQPRIGRVDYSQAMAAIAPFEQLVAADLADEPLRTQVLEHGNDVLTALHGLGEWGQEAAAVGRTQPDLVVVLG